MESLGVWLNGDQQRLNDSHMGGMITNSNERQHDWNAAVTLTGLVQVLECHWYRCRRPSSRRACSDCHVTRRPWSRVSTVF